MVNTMNSSKAAARPWNYTDGREIVRVRYVTYCLDCPCGHHCGHRL